LEDVLLESALSYIIDLEDASISTPESKLEAYRIVRGIVKGDLECEVRGKTRKMLSAESYIDPRTSAEFDVSSSAVALVRDVGLHLLVDQELLSIDGRAYSEKILDCYITSLCGARYHVAPKMHGADEVAYTYELFEEINRLQGISSGANKVGIMNEEVRTTAQLGKCITAAEQVVFFTNTGFLDYTGSYIDLMMHQGPIAPYRDLPGKTYKSSYEVYNVNESLLRAVPQIGAGMWAKIRDMKGLMLSKKEQVEGCTDTGWSPSPSAATLHALAFHLYGDVRELQSCYLENLPDVKIESLFEFPRVDLENLTHQEIIENLDFAIHGLLAYAEPWVRRGVGCSGVMELSGEPLMEDRATARIKAAFVRNWLLHDVVTNAEVGDSIKRMVALVNKQNSGTERYQALVLEGDPVVEAVENLVFNPKQYQHSYVEFYFYEANRKANGATSVYNTRFSS
jgi:malate synthase